MARRRRWPGLTLALLGAVVAAALFGRLSGGTAPKPLPVLAIDRAATSVSGLSSGAYMAGQMQLAHGRAIVGAGLIAGGPFACAESPAARLLPWPASVPQNLARALSRCMGAAALGLPDVERLRARADELARSGAIDPLDTLSHDRVYLFSGGADRTVGRAVVDAARDFYLAAGVPREAIAFLHNPAAGHAFLTEAEGEPCGATQPPFVNDCDHDQAGVILAHIYGELAPPPPEPRGAFALIDQTPFTAGLTGHGLDDAGFLYVPDACRRGPGCRLHVVFHGCGQARANVGDRFVKTSGFARHADNNRIVLLFPQVAVSSLNRQGCWDWWGYTARDYLTKSAPQIAAVWRMAERLAAAD